MSAATTINYSIVKSLDAGPEGYVTKVKAEVMFDSSRRSPVAVGFGLTIVHLGAALTCGLDGRALYGCFEHGELLQKVLDGRGFLKALGPWDKPVNLDVAILYDLEVLGVRRSGEIAVNAILDSVRSFAGACGYLLVPEPTAVASRRVIASMKANGLFEALPGLLAIALDYTHLPPPKSINTPDRRLDS